MSNPSNSSSISSGTSDTGSSSSSVVSTGSSSSSVITGPPSSSSSTGLPSTTSSQPLSNTNTKSGTALFTTFTTSTIVTQSGPTTSATGGAVDTASKGFFANKPAVGATFAIAGLAAVGLIFVLITATFRRRRARRFDREIAEEAKRAPPAPVFMDDDDGYGPGGYSAYGGDPYAAHHQPQQYDYPHSNDGQLSGEGTPSNYKFASGYSDLGFSEVSSHGTYTQQPMEAQYNNAGNYGAYAVGAGAGAYEMTGYGGHHGGYGAPQQQQQDGWQHQPQQAYVYPGDDQAHAQGYPPGAASSTTDSSATLGRSKSGAARSLVSDAAAGPGKMPQYADGYVAQYQNQPHVVEHDDSVAYGGVESMHGHVGGDYEYEAEDDEEIHHPKVLKVANE